MSWKTEACVSGQWSTNACRYATEKEAEEAGKELLSRWFSPTDSRATETPDAVNYRFDFDAYKPVRTEEGGGNVTVKQKQAILKLEKSGFKLSYVAKNGDVVMVKKINHGHESFTVDLDGDTF